MVPPLVEVVYATKQEARAASRKALEAELALAKAQGAGDMPALLPIAHDYDFQDSLAFARSYAKAWLKTALEEVDAITSRQSNKAQRASAR